MFNDELSKASAGMLQNAYLNTQYEKNKSVYFPECCVFSLIKQQFCFNKASTKSVCDLHNTVSNRASGNKL